MKNMVIARRYAKALLLIGKENGQAEHYREELGGFADLIAGEKELGQIISNPLYEAASRRKVLQAVLEKVDLSKVVRQFLLLVFDKGRFVFLETIYDFYRKLADDLKGVARASLISATDLPDETIEKIKAALEKRTGKEVSLEVEKDPTLIGGIVTKIGDLVLDGSVRTQLLSMRESLKRGESV